MQIFSLYGWQIKILIIPRQEFGDTKKERYTNLKREAPMNGWNAGKVHEHLNYKKNNS